MKSINECCGKPQVVWVYNKLFVVIIRCSEWRPHNKKDYTRLGEL